ncbi:glycosyltransferase family 2 protein [Clostridium sp. YIM B02505]|uniref:Glycosyltransferase family 2 protein n=1 Tax=Clostridium yunnanense TaxID=2800325 RepID=A0ABS1ETJ6_9CLOT|nr:glycosyltransferase family A protein [Clostridium yunnanense]MBK1812709.1 glycosyltransferase family 2 protein [Clostridium yunnanense]
MMKIEAVTVCINYSHVLKYCLDNKKYLDNWIIVTEKNDIDTINLCNENSINYIFSERIHENGAEFAKGKAINEGINALNKEDWILLMDCDIILPPNVRDVISEISKTEKNLKSLFSPIARRGLGLGKEESKYIDYRCTKNIQNLNKIHEEFIAARKGNENSPDIEKIHMSALRHFVDTGLFESELDTIEEQWESYKTGNWNDLPYIFEGGEPHFTGYYQMFHSSNFEKYPEDSNNSWWDDTDFRNSYPVDNRILLDFECIHVGYNSGAQESLSQLDKLFYSK